jgi:hypothetical protein
MCEPDTTLSVKYEPQFVQRHFRLTSGTSPFQPVIAETAPGREISQATSAYAG